MARNTKVRAEESFPMIARGYTRGQLLDETECDVLKDTGDKQVLYVQIILSVM